MLIGECRKTFSPHPKNRQWAEPQGGYVIRQNPPSLFWPTVSQDNVSYSVRLSKDSSFSTQNTMSADNIRWAMFNPHDKLDTGVWFWQYKIQKQRTAGNWSNTFKFIVPDSARVFITPTSNELIKACKQPHPRIFDRQQ